MADLSRSLPRPQVSATLSKKVSSNGNGFTANNVYQDVFGGPSKFGVPTFSSRIDDYSEVFGGYHASRGSSIPILDLPDVDESTFLIDVRSSKFDYSEVFGGSECADFAVPYEELFAEPGGVESSSEDVWTPAETGSPSEGSSEDPSCVENTRAFSNGKSHHPSYESVQQINTFYHKSNQMSREDGMSGTTHVAQLNAVPAFTLVVDEDIPKQKEKYEKSLHQVANEGNLNVDSFIELTDGKLLGNNSSRPASGDAVSRSSENIPRAQRNPDGNGTSPENAFLTVTEINLRTCPSHIPPPSRPPPKLSIKQGESKRAIDSSLSKYYAFEGAAKDGSPAFFDVEVDASSSAAASAAAMKEAMEKAQARLKSAKVSMERKRDGLHNRKKLGLKEDFIVKGKAESETANEACRFKEDKSCYRKFEKENDEIKGLDRDERQQAQSSQVAPAFEAQTNLLNVSKEDQMSVKEWISNHEAHQQEGAGEHKAEKQLSEPVHMDKLKPAFRSSEKERVGTKLMPGAKVYESQQNGKQPANMLFEEQDEKGRKLNVSQEKCEREENEKKIEVAKEVHEWEESKKKVCSATSNGNLEREHERKSKATHKKVERDKKVEEMCLNGVCEQKEPGKILKEVYEWKEPEKKQKKACEQKKNEIEYDDACQWVENEKNQRYANEREENAKRVKVAREQEENGRIQEEIPELEENKRKQKEACEREEDQQTLNKAIRQEEHDQRAKMFLEQEENEKQQKDSHGREGKLKKLEELEEGKENEKRLKEVCGKEEIEKQQKEAREKGNEKLKELQEQEEDEKQQKEAHIWEEKEKELKELKEQEENAKKLKEAHERNEIQRRRKEDGEREEEEKIIKEALEQEEKVQRKQEACDREDSGKKLKAPQDTYICKEDEKNLKTVTGLYESNESTHKFKASSETCILSENILKATCEAHGQEEENTARKVAQKPCEQKESGKVTVTAEHDLEKNEKKELNAAKVALELEKNEDLAMAYFVQGAAEHEVPGGKVKADSKFECGRSDKKLQEAKVAEEDEKKRKAKETAFDGEDNKKTCRAVQNVRQGDGNGNKMEAGQLACMLDEKRDRSNVVNNNNTRHKVEKESNLSEIPKMVERVKEERIEREKEQEMERLRKLEEEREREREREKDRMAVERVTREARERAYAEARERAERAAVERATAEARQRAMAEARERLEKASMEARLRAERAAVERATAEAQERAMERAMAGKAGLGARERVDRSVSEKFSTTSRDSGVKHSSSFSDLRDSQFQGSGSFNGAQRYPDSSSHAFAAEKSQGAEAESAQRCKARLERHQRTVQRAAKALAEKNMRDLLAQREQVERNRLAETLDADVKRWSSGKEGNLRALLSTLQYILGPESGWQPIPLTEVITAVAVKKAYRKATLCVHPDKLQQRGASIQQKYICEKVFDLLKEAWNKFNSEER